MTGLDYFQLVSKDGQRSLLIEEVNFVHVDRQFYGCAFFEASAAVNTSNYAVFADTVQVQEHFVTQVLGYLDVSIHDCVRGSFQEYWLFVEIFRTNAHNDFFTYI